MTDLTFDQLRIAMIASGISADAISIAHGKVVIDIGAVLGSDCKNLTQEGVIKFLTKLLDAFAKAQARVNQNKTRGQRLIALYSQVSLDKQFATTTFTFRTQHEISSATRIIGGGIGLPAPPIRYDPSAALILGII